MLSSMMLMAVHHKLNAIASIIIVSITFDKCSDFSLHFYVTLRAIKQSLEEVELLTL